MDIDKDVVDIRNECGEVLGVQCQARDCEECEEGLSLMDLYKEKMEKNITFNTEKAACDFVDWLVEHDYLDFEEGIADQNDFVTDFRNAYEVAPRLIHLLADIADK